MNSIRDMWAGKGFGPARQKTRRSPGGPRECHMSEATSVSTAVAPRPSAWFVLGDFVLCSVSTLAGAVGYLMLGFALFAVTSAGYAWYSLRCMEGSTQFIEEFLRFSLFLVLYGAAPPFAFACLWQFFVDSWRKACGQPSLFAERGQHPMVMAAAAIFFCALTWNAHASLSGEWRELPRRMEVVLGFPDKPHHHEAPTVARRTPPLHAPVQPAVILPNSEGGTAP